MKMGGITNGKRKGENGNVGTHDLATRCTHRLHAAPGGSPSQQPRMRLGVRQWQSATFFLYPPFQGFPYFL